MPRAVVLLSGGLDSYTAAAVAKSEGLELFALSVRYGQRHACELDAARSVAGDLGVAQHIEMELDLSQFGGSALTSAMPVPKDRPLDAMQTRDVDHQDQQDIPVTYVPARNMIFLSLALGWAEVLGAEDLVIGVNALDYSGYPDCRPEFICAFEHLAAVGTRAGIEGNRIRVRTPLINLRKAEIITLGLSLGLDYSLTHSCYDPQPDGGPCLRCDSCVLRAKGFEDAGVADPLLQ